MDILTDMDYGWNESTQEFDVPTLQWQDAIYGHTYWTRYSSEEERDLALNTYKMRCQGEADRPRCEALAAELAEELAELTKQGEQ